MGVAHVERERLADPEARVVEDPQQRLEAEREIAIKCFSGCLQQFPEF
jgi:hypothetical protein